MSARDLHAVLRAAGVSSQLTSVKHVASGRFGSVYFVRGEHGGIRRLQEWLVSNGDDRVCGARCPAGVAAVKLQALPSAAWARDARGEDHCHRRVCRGTRGRAVAPEFFAGATLHAGSLRVTMMEALASSGGAAMRGGKELERIVTAAWRAGVVHGDLHPGNVVVLPNGSARLVDFGMAVCLPRKTTAKLVAALKTMPAAEAFDAVCLDRVRGVMRRRGVDLEHATMDGDALRHDSERQQRIFLGEEEGGGEEGGATCATSATSSKTTCRR
jgi:hypothetical protein